MSEEDFLESDPQIRGQNYCCLSFVSPEEVLNNKNVFFVHKFLKTIAKSYDLDEESIENKYKDFMYINQEKLESEFYEKNEFKTTVRGIKVRGSYDTLQEAQAKAKKLQQNDKNFNVYIGQVGFWLPWDPNPHNIDSQEYAESELNTLVKKYRENQEKKDQHFQENIEYAREQAEKQKKETTENNSEKDGDEGEKVVNDDASKETPVNTESIEESLAEEDPWLKRKSETD
tara:strand:+ start:4961 stop:5650 length:690 start_codon:yes stop_codon:yes gene_type:complete